MLSSSCFNSHGCFSTCSWSSVLQLRQGPLFRLSIAHRPSCRLPVSLRVSEMDCPLSGRYNIFPLSSGRAIAILVYASPSCISRMNLSSLIVVVSLLWISHLVFFLYFSYESRISDSSYAIAWIIFVGSLCACAPCTARVIPFPIRLSWSFLLPGLYKTSYKATCDVCPTE